jgi:hypothetical protein
MDAATFDVDRAMWDPEKPHLMWVLVKSTGKSEGEYAARLWFTTDGSNPQDWRNENRRLALLDAREMDDAPEDEPHTTVITGLLANEMPYGLPWDAAIQEIPKDEELLLFVECCQETD